MLIYHGSEKRIECPVLGLGNPRNEYGRGFYCTESLELAKELACQKNSDGFANSYELDLSGLKVLDLSAENFSILHWLIILMQNRVFSPKSPLGRANLEFLTEKFQVPYQEYDVIKGYRANDSYFSFASDFLENVIPIQNLASSMKLGSLGLQVVLKSEKAFAQLQFKDAEKADKEEYYVKYHKRDDVARKNYLDGLRKLRPSDGAYLIDIVRNPRLLDEIRL